MAPAAAPDQVKKRSPPNGSDLTRLAKLLDGMTDEIEVVTSDIDSLKKITVEGLCQ